MENMKPILVCVAIQFRMVNAATTAKRSRRTGDRATDRAAERQQQKHKYVRVARRSNGNDKEFTSIKVPVGRMSSNKWNELIPEIVSLQQSKH